MPDSKSLIRLHWRFCSALVSQKDPWPWHHCRQSSQRWSGAGGWSSCMCPFKIDALLVRWSLSMTNCSFGWLIDWLTHWLIHWLTHWGIYLCLIKFVLVTCHVLASSSRLVGWVNESINGWVNECMWTCTVLAWTNFYVFYCTACRALVILEVRA